MIKASDILPPGSLNYREGERVTTEGWLKETFLYGPDDAEFINITLVDRKAYEEAVKLFKQVNGISRYVEILDWEDNPKNTAVKQAKAINKFLKEKKAWVKKVAKPATSAGKPQDQGHTTV